jgi:hyperosmotically inducible periplasmic protein
MHTKTMIVIAAASIAFVRAGADAQLDAATNAAGSVAGQVNTGLPQRSDPQLALEVQAKLSQQVDISGVTSQTHDGVATLRGTVRSQAERDRAEQIARTVDGITRIDNRIVVNPESASIVAQDKAAGNTLETDVRANLDANARLSGQGIGIQTRGNIVTLTGEVSSVADKELAGRIATDTREVAEVRNRLVVRGGD